MVRNKAAALVLFTALATPATVEGQAARGAYVGVLAGIATLSADARSEIGDRRVESSSYKPENGPALNVLAGLHVHDYVTVQANYIWNRNDVALESLAASSGALSFYRQPRSASQHAAVGDLLVYFRPRHSAIRPYLSTGIGVSRLTTSPAGPVLAQDALPPDARLRAAELVLRVAVGLDWSLGRGIVARYSFSEGISRNPIGRQLSPPGQRGLANFQNLFGVVWMR